MFTKSTLQQSPRYIFKPISHHIRLLSLMMFCPLQAYWMHGANAADGPCQRAVTLAQRVESAGDRLGSDRKRVLFKEAVELCPTMAEIHYNFGQFLAQQGEQEEAKRSFEKAIEIEERVEFLLGLARVLLTQSKNAEAKQVYENILTRDKLHPSALQGLAIISERQGNRDLAISQFAQSLAVEPDNPITQFNLAVLYEKKGLKEEALAMYEKAIEVGKGQSKEALFRAGLLHFQNGETAAAIKNLERASTLAPSDVRFFRALGVAYQQTGRLSKAELAFRKALALDNGDQVTRKNLGFILLQMKKPAQVVELYEEFLDSERRAELSTEELYLNAIAKRELGELGDTQQLLLQAHEISPKDARILKELVAFFSRSGNQKEQQRFERLLSNELDTKND